MKLLFNITCMFFVFLFTEGQTNSAYPEFSWDKVPIAFHFGKSDSLMTATEAQFVATHSNFIVLEKGHGQRYFGNTEEGIAAEAKLLKVLNPDIKIVFYWNSFLDYPLYKASEVYNKNKKWWLKKEDGKFDFKNKRIKRYDLSNTDVRDWWTEVAKTATADPNVDGVFMDALIQVAAPKNKRLWGEAKYDSVQQGLSDMIDETRLKIGDDKLIVFNGIRSTHNRLTGNNFSTSTDAVMIEHFGHFASKSPASMLSDIELMQQSGKEGNIVVFKTWPEYSWLDKEFMALPLKEKQTIAKNNIIFNLAAFLIGAQKHSYFIYNWGYRINHGCLEWYPEYDKPLGKPKGDFIKNGYVLTREFQHAKVIVNLEDKEKSSIIWH